MATPQSKFDVTRLSPTSKTAKWSDLRSWIQWSSVHLTGCTLSDDHAFCGNVVLFSYGTRGKFSDLLFLDLRSVILTFGFASTSRLLVLLLVMVDD